MLRRLFEKYNFHFDDKTILKFQLFLELFKEKNSQINLSSIRDDKGIIEKHFIDSLMLTKFIDLSGKIADIGTGGGFPLIPLAIVENWKLNGCHTERNAMESKYPSNLDIGIKQGLRDSSLHSEGQTIFYGIDSVAKKLKAIDDFAKELELENIKIIHSRFEDIGHEKIYRESFDFVVSRATAYFHTLLEYTIPLLKVGGIFIAYKLENQVEIDEGKKALEELNSKIIDIKKYSLGGNDRTLIFVQKLAKTPSIFPRNAGIPLKKPLI